MVIESGKKGGSLITAELAFNYNRDVFAFPGRVGDTKSQGCNALIKRDIAGLIENTEDFLKAMNWLSKTPQKKPVQKELFVSLNEEESKVYNYLKDKNETFVDIISVECGIPQSRLSAILLNLEFNGLVSSFPGKFYKAL